MKDLTIQRIKEDLDKTDFTNLEGYERCAYLAGACSGMRIILRMRFKRHIRDYRLSKAELTELRRLYREITRLERVLSYAANLEYKSITDNIAHER